MDSSTQEFYAEHELRLRQIRGRALERARLRYIEEFTTIERVYSDALVELFDSALGESGAAESSESTA